MRLPVFLLALVVTARGAVGRRAVNTDKDYEIERYFDKLIPVINDTILNQNSGPNINADPGVITTVIPDPASPQFSLYYVRDAAILHHVWLNKLITSSEGDPNLRALLNDAVLAFIRTQHIDNPTGGLFTGGLDEVAFDLPLGQITDPRIHGFIGAPGGDGPPSRAGVLIKFAEWLTKPEQNNGTWVADVLWQAIDLDLQWISLHWNQSSWDLWAPSVWAGSYWTASLQYRALRTGARLGRKIGRAESAPLFDAHASVVLQYLQTFWNEKKGFMSETTVVDITTGGRSGIGAAALTVSVLNFDPTLGCDSATFQPCSERALMSLKYLIDVYRAHYPINQGIPKNEPVLIGDYPESTFLGGGAQYFATFNTAEQLFDAVLTWNLLGELNVTKRTSPFFKLFIDGEPKVGRHRKGSPTYKILTDGITAWAKNTILLVSKHTPADYVLPLSINGTSGEPYGPRGALRSMAAALSARDAYNGLIPPTWAYGSVLPLARNNLEGRIHGYACASEELF